MVSKQINKSSNILWHQPAILRPARVATSSSSSSILFVIFVFILINVNAVRCTNDAYSNDSYASLIDRNFKMLSNKTFCQMYSKKCIIKLLINDAKLLDTLKIISTSTKIVRFKSIEWCGSRNLSSKIKKYCIWKRAQSLVEARGGARGLRGT